jgi:hypothetical protein
MHDDFPDLFCSPAKRGSYNKVVEYEVGNSDQMNHFIGTDLPRIVQALCPKQN